MRLRQPWKTCALALGCSALQIGVLSAAQPGGAGSAAHARTLEARNLARLAAGARLEVQSPGGTVLTENTGASNALLRDDDPLGYELAQGSTSLIISLPKIEVLNRFDFLNLTAHGKVGLAISGTKLPVDSPQWRSVQTMDFSGDNGVVTCDLGSVDAKYVRISFEVPAEGRIDTFGLYGQRTLGEGLAARGLAAKGAGSDVRFVMFNYAVDSPHAGIVMVSPGENLDEAQQMADGDVGTTYSFKPGDPAPMAVVDLGESRQLTRVGASFKAGPGRLAIYLVADPKRRSAEVTAHSAAKKGASGPAIEDVISTDFPGDRTPVLALDTGIQPGLNRVSANVAGQTGRYLVMMFHPSGPLPAVGNADFKDFKDSTAADNFKDVDGGHNVSDAPAAHEPLQIAEITGFGNIPPGTDLTNGTPLLPGIPPSGPGGPTGPLPPPVAPPGAGVITP